MAKFTMKSDDAGCAAQLVFKDKKGNPVGVVGAPEWTMSADGIVDMTVAPDGLSAQFVPTDAPGAIGTVTITVKAEGDPTPGVDTIVLTGDIEVIAAEAVVGELSFSPLP